MNQDRKDKIVDDLLLRYPKGVRGKLKKSDYDIDERYDYDRGTYVKFVETIDGRSDNWGWTAEDLFDLNFKNQDQVEAYIKERFFENDITHRGGYGSKRATMTRKVRRLWNRVSPAVRKVVNEGGKGVYHIKSSGYRGDNLGHIFASSKEKAENIAAVMLAHVLTEDDRRYGNGIQAQLVTRDDIQGAVAKNATFFRRMESSIEESENRIKQIEKEIERKQAKLAAMMGLQSMLLDAQED